MQGAEEEAEEELPPSGAAWCFAAVMAFMAMLLVRHMFELFSTEQVHQQDSGKPPDTVLGPEASAGMLLLWLTVRFLVILIPMYAVLRVMHTVRDQQMQQEADRDLEQELASMLWVSNIDLMAYQVLCDGDMTCDLCMCKARQAGVALLSVWLLGCFNECVCTNDVHHVTNTLLSLATQPSPDQCMCLISVLLFTTIIHTQTLKDLLDSWEALQAVSNFTKPNSANYSYGYKFCCSRCTSIC